MIRVPQVRVVDEDGAQLGVLPTGEALRLAQERGYDLVEVAPTASPPVVKLLDFGQYKYELAKREKEAKRRSRSVEFKEIRLKPKIGTGDFDTKVHRAIQFLEEGDRIKVTVQFRGRELTHPEIGRNLLAKFTDRVKDHGVLERAPLLEGRAMHIIIASSHKPKMREAIGRHQPRGDARERIGRDVAPVYIGDQTRGEGTVRTLAEQVALETRTRMLNPKWYEGMLQHGYEGVRQIEVHVTNTMGWSATTGQVAPWVYQQLSETFVLDPAMRERLAHAQSDRVGQGRQSPARSARAQLLVAGCKDAGSAAPRGRGARRSARRRDRGEVGRMSVATVPMST